MTSLLAVSFFGNELWYAVPLILSISLVYGATRHEDLGQILRHAGRSFSYILSFMALIFVVLFFLSWRL